MTINIHNVEDIERYDNNDQDMKLSTNRKQANGRSDYSSGAGSGSGAVAADADAFSSSSKVNTTIASTTICRVCHLQDAQYKCPRCKIQYCSIKCYRDHASGGGSNGGSDLNTVSTSTSSSVLCSESFFRDRVNSIIELENKEQKEQTRHMIQRQAKSAITRDDEDGAIKAGLTASDIDEEELIELLMKLEAIEQGRLDNDDDNSDGIDVNDRKRGLDTTFGVKDLRELLPPALRAEFEKDIMNADRVQALLHMRGSNDVDSNNLKVVHQWYPWWSPEIVPISRDKSEGKKITQEEDNSSDDFRQHEQKTTLDDRLLKIPNFRQLTEKKDPSTAFDNSLLLWNLIELVYSSCWILRLYYGTTNILNDVDTTLEATNCLLEVSIVLNSDGGGGSDNTVATDRTNRRFHDLSEVLSYCTAASTAAMKRNATAMTNNLVGCNTPWHILVEDVARITSSHRMVGRLLLEVCDIIQSTIRQVKKNQNQKTKKKAAVASTHKSHHCSKSMTNHEKDRSDAAAIPQDTLVALRRKNKKLEFYLSWSQQPDLCRFGSDLRDDVVKWAEDFTMTDE